MRKFIQYFVLPIALVVIGGSALGCTAVHEFHVDKSFTGLRAAMKPGRTVCILFIHGLSGYTDGDPDFMIAEFQKRLGLRAVGKATAESLNLPDKIEDAAQLSRQDFVGDNDTALHTYTLTWEPIAQAIKNKFIGYDNSPDITANRLSLDVAIKSWLMYERAADVALYGGIGKQKIQGAVRRSLKIMQQDVEKQAQGKPDYRYFFVTWSMGSKIMFDCLRRTNPGAPTQPAVADNNSEKVVFDRIASHTSGVFMLANQLPFLAMIEQHPATQPSDVPAADESVSSFIERRRTAAATPESTGSQSRLSIVAVSDPNDLLSYPISDWFRQHADADLADVRISVAQTGAWIPFLMGGGWTINPLTAHTGYGKDEKVIEMIVEGATATGAK